MRIAGRLMLADGPGRVRLSPGWLRVEGGLIAELVEGEADGPCALGGRDCVVLPGLIDAHVHLPQFGVVGAHGLGLLDWLDRVTFPAERAWADVGVARAQAASAMRRMLSCGTTGFAAYATSHHAGALAALGVAEGLGVRACIGQVLMDRNGPGDLCPAAGRQLDETGALLERYPGGGRVSAAVTPRFGPTCSEGLLVGAGELARTHRAVVQTHLAETRSECAWVRELFGHDSITEVYRDAHLLTERTVLGHGIYLSDEDRQVLADHGSAIAHCPLANSFLMSGRFDRARALGAGVGVALGSDIGAGYEASMVRVGRAMLETAGALAIDRLDDAGAGHVDPDGRLPSAAEAWHAITAGNADALGWPDAGRLAVGCPADIVVVAPDHVPDPGATPDPLASLLFGWDDRWVSATLLRGRVAWPADPGQDSSAR